MCAFVCVCVYHTSVCACVCMCVCARACAGAHMCACITFNMQCVTWYEGTAQLLSLTELNSHLF